MYELSDSELDMVAGGANPVIQVGDLIAANVEVTDVLSLRSAGEMYRRCNPCR
jgi:hypothetical protein